jgi:hypothetical protein
MAALTCADPQRWQWTAILIKRWIGTRECPAADLATLAVNVVHDGEAECDVAPRLPGLPHFLHRTFHVIHVIMPHGCLIRRGLTGQMQQQSSMHTEHDQHISQGPPHPAAGAAQQAASLTRSLG